VDIWEEEKRDSDGDRSFHSYIAYTFDVSLPNGTTQCITAKELYIESGWKHEGSWTRQVGEPVAVRYLPQNPTIFTRHYEKGEIPWGDVDEWE
jgi:hypothetical protein